ncbi:DNA repair protein XRCC3 homolog [Eutrema salsugineum]|uniref:DNA repair protein XRCC3 homolog n=1 Tax=Eutrema salsugineum TaxID=72664 RepID=UPI000CED34AD|nr:DNA repair protein XRCC3 homolog [Eutrema salsugineum]XP_024011628.1 DNA repair protein XRCC3 homolog [Eutrema salsugineum]XP_024011629.1 DNA repair protein XRCC3 homolog [Eutrema salsugineum]XP_024011630.1 DNA repair protein XRCC3 homolog [Eutrema salsugineum]XP_024011631.1 DNA repair protein XRCC3 homolog [Eutrema salsugineum]
MKPQNLGRQSPTSRKLTTGCEIIDGCLRGGFPCNSLTEIVAESGCGKTQLCLQLSLCAQLPISHGGLDGSALYLHSEFPFPFRRLHQLSRSFHQSNPSIYANHNDNPCDHVFVQNVNSVDHLFDIMPRIDAFVGNTKNRFPLKLIVLDSVAALFRSEFDNTPSDLRKRASLFFKISGKLKQLANNFDLAVVITNQVTDLVESSDGLSGLRIGNLRYLYSSGRRVVPALGLAWANCVNSRFFISRSNETICKENDESGRSSVSIRAQRRLEIVFSPHLPGSSCEFKITPEGICEV